MSKYSRNKPCTLNDYLKINVVPSNPPILPGHSFNKNFWLELRYSRENTIFMWKHYGVPMILSANGDKIITTIFIKNVLIRKCHLGNKFVRKNFQLKKDLLTKNEMKHNKMLGKNRKLTTAPAHKFLVNLHTRNLKYMFKDIEFYFRKHEYNSLKVLSSCALSCINELPMNESIYKVAIMCFYYKIYGYINIHKTFRGINSYRKYLQFKELYKQYNNNKIRANWDEGDLYWHYNFVAIKTNLENNLQKFTLKFEWELNAYFYNHKKKQNQFWMIGNNFVKRKKDNRIKITLKKLCKKKCVYCSVLCSGGNKKCPQCLSYYCCRKCFKKAWNRNIDLCKK